MPHGPAVAGAPSPSPSPSPYHQPHQTPGVPGFMPNHPAPPTILQPHFPSTLPIITLSPQERSESYGITSKALPARVKRQLEEFKIWSTSLYNTNRANMYAAPVQSTTINKQVCVLGWHAQPARHLVHHPPCLLCPYQGRSVWCMRITVGLCTQRKALITPSISAFALALPLP